MRIYVIIPNDENERIEVKLAFYENPQMAAENIANSCGFRLSQCTWGYC